MVHWDCKGQTGAAMTMGKGAVLSYSWKQKINTKSSTETELVGVDDTISNILWSLYFMQEQGCGTTHAIIYQDNKSAILLESNGKFSSGKRTKHIKAKYFFVTDKMAEGDIVVKHAPTETMWADINTKPKLGRAFRIDRSHLMNCDEDYTEAELCAGDGSETQKHYIPELTSVPHDTTQTRVQPSRNVSWARSQECVGNGRKLGGRSSWDNLTSALRRVLKRLGW